MKNNNWQEKKLGNIATFINGKAFKPSDWSDTGLPIIRIQNLTNSIDDIHYYNGDIEEKYRITTGDILISWSATIGVFEWLNGDAVLNQHIFKVVFDKEPIDKTFFKHLIKQKIDEMLKNVHGSTMKHITKGDFDNIDVLLPSLDEQKKIAKILDKADEIRAKKKLANDKLDEFLKSTFISMFGTLARNEKQFQIKQLQDIAIKITDGSHFSPKTVETSNYPYVTVKDICNDRIDFDTCKFISKEDYDDLVKNGCRPELNDVLFSKDGTVGKVSLVDYSREFVVLSSLAIIRPDIKIVKPQYLKWALKNPEFLQNATNEKTGVAIRRIILKTLKTLAIILPPMNEQYKFAKIVEHVKAQKQKNELVIEQMNNLFNSLSQRAFKGEL